MDNVGFTVIVGDPIDGIFAEGYFGSVGEAQEYAEQVMHGCSWYVLPIRGRESGTAETTA